MPNIGGPELLLILAVVLIVFGAGKLPDVLGQLGRGVQATASGVSTATAAPGTTYCRNCGRPNVADSKFCSNCGQAL